MDASLKPKKMRYRFGLAHKIGDIMANKWKISVRIVNQWKSLFREREPIHLILAEVYPIKSWRIAIGVLGIVLIVEWVLRYVPMQSGPGYSSGSPTTIKE